MKNKYVKHAHISEVLFRKVLKMFCADIPARTAGGLTGLSVQGTQRLYEESRFAHNPDDTLKGSISESSRTHFDRAKNGPVTEVFERGIYFWRAYEGIMTFGLGGGGGVHVSFGNNGTLSEISIVMRQLKIRQTVQFDSTVDIESALRQGRAVSDTVSRPSAVSKIRVIGVTPFLLELSGSDPQQVVWPVIEAKCTADTADGEQPFRIFIDPRRTQRADSGTEKNSVKP